LADAIVRNEEQQPVPVEELLAPRPDLAASDFDPQGRGLLEEFQLELQLIAWLQQPAAVADSDGLAACHWALPGSLGRGLL